MRPWMIPILGAVALSLAVPTTADARMRFGPGAILGAFAAPLGIIGGARRSVAHRHQRTAEARANAKSEAKSEARSEARSDAKSEARTEDEATDGRRAARAEPGRTERPAASGASPVASGAVFWPHASDDLLSYAFFPRSKDDAFWTIGYGAILGSAFAAVTTDAPRPRRGRAAASKVSDAAGATKPAAPLPGAAETCGNPPAATSADALIGRIEQAIKPSDAQRPIIAELHIALVQAIERIDSACPASAPTTAAERLQAAHDRISAMHDALLTLRTPFERFYASLDGDQDSRLAREADVREATGAVAIAEDRKEPRGHMCTEQAAEIAGWPMQAIGRALQPDAQQRAAFETLRLRLGEIAKLVVSSCPTYPLLGPLDRLTAVDDRLNVMLFALTTMTPALPDFYDSLSDKQRLRLNTVVRQFIRRPPRTAAARSS